MHRLLILGLLALCGCSGSNGVATVEGTITLDGKPLTGVRVRFEPDGANPNPGSASYAITGTDGRYALQQVDPDQPGAVVGPHIVRVTTVFPSEGDGGIERADPIPARYNNSSELRFEVPATGSTSADFTLTSKR